nr:zinc finger, CCHC-type [Tanacetum cinerariifolium]
MSCGDLSERKEKADVTLRWKVNGENATMEQIRKRNKWDNDDYVYRGLILNALGWHLEEIYVTWAHLEKKRTRLHTYTKALEEICSQSMETATPT